MAAHPHPYRPHATHHKYKRQRLAAVLVAVVTILLWCGRTRPAEAGPQGGDYEPKERVAAHQATQQPQLTIGKVSEEADSAGLDWEAVDSELPAGLVADDDTEGNANSSGGSAKDSVANLAADLASDEVLAELGEGMKGQRQGQEQQQQRAGGGDQGDHQQHVGKPQGMLRPHRQLRCAVVNNRGWHLDVAGGFAWAFQAAGCNVTLYLPDRNIFGIKAVMDSWFTGDHRPVANLLTETAEFDVYAIATFPETHTSALDALMNMKLPGRSMQRRLSQRFLAVVHNADRLMIKAKPARWARFGAMQHVPRDIVQQPDRWPAWQPRRLQLFTLAPFTAQYLAELLQQWSLSSKGPAGIANIAWMPPLAPWLPSFAEGQSAATPGGLGGDISDADGDIFSGSNAHGHLCIQGILDPKRRDYAAAFDALSHPAVLAQLRRHNESLLLLGHVSTLRPTAIVPPHLEPYVRTLSGLPYMEFYDTLARCRAILPAFSSAQYLVSKSSSTTATAINVATPLVAESRVRDAFTFLSPDTLFDYNAPGGEAAPDIPATAKKDAHLYTWMDASVMLAGGGLAPEEVWTAEDEARQQQQRRQMSEGEDGAGDRDAAEVEPGSLGVDPDGPSSGEEADGTAANASLMQLRHLGQGDGEEGAGRQVQAGDAGSSGLLGGQAWAKKELDDGTEPELQLGREVAPDGQLGEPEHAAATALPEPGSYAHALLQLFEPGASSAAHAATRKLKAHLMQRNKEVAAQFLAETVQLMAAVDAKFQAEDGAESAWQ